ncbi:MAG: DUF3604 domain-containing protein [Gammaproteobacteria bacterium]|nr:MAG: DUF3604 domain-containing protein [Gammaproteobacteria bacterium]
MTVKPILQMFSLLFSALFFGNAVADSQGEPGRGTEGANPLKNVYFGEQHLHTADSPDAFAMGVLNTQDDAFRFCKGEPIKKMVGGYTVQKKTPYDWCAVTDHAVMMGLLPMTLYKDSPLYKTKVGSLIRSGTSKNLDAAFGILMSSVQKGAPPAGFDDPALAKSAWEAKKKNVNKHNDPGKFTTLIAFEWTSIPYGQNLHRNVFFRDDVGPEMPFSTLDSDRAEDLWTYMEVQRDMGHETFAIPHNSNLSNGLMFPTRNSYGQPITAAWMKRRAKNEIAVEILQTKGTSDTHPAISPDDEFADFEGEFKHMLGTGGVVGKINNSFVRAALIDGVGWQESEGVNPHKFGIVAGADAHTSFSDNEEFNYTGVHGVNDATVNARLSGAGQTAGEAAIMFGTPGATAVWAHENTRTEIFDGMVSKETYGTSGPLIRLRFFGGWGYENNLHKNKDFVKKAYAGGVPMGGDLPVKPASTKAPTFAVWALKDPDSGNLDRIQIIKGWYKDGYAWERVYDVAWSDGRKPAGMKGEVVKIVTTDGLHVSTVYRTVAPGKLPPVGNTVDVKNASYTNTIGDNELSATWTDPDFDPSQHAVYFVRVIEIPTPRWSTYDAKAKGIAPLSMVPTTIQERAWSSPIWYTPAPSLVKKAVSYPGLRDYLPE